MLSKRIIPCLDLKNGRVVKGLSFQALRDAGNPIDLATRYQQQGADELVLLDVSATLEGRVACLETIAVLRNHLAIPLTVGGGVRSTQDVQSLLHAGADKVAINSAAITTPNLIDDMAQKFGRQCTVLALDAARNRNNRGWEVIIDSGQTRTGLDVIDWACQAEARGAGEILLTSWDRDGARQGYDLDLIRDVSSKVRIPIIASGGAGRIEDLVAGLTAGADAVLVASLLHYGLTSLHELKVGLVAGGFEVRP